MSLLHKGRLVAPLDLLQHLDTIYPDRCPDPLDTPAQMWMKAGARALLDGLWVQYHDFHGTSSDV